MALASGLAGVQRVQPDLESCDGYSTGWPGPLVCDGLLLLGFYPGEGMHAHIYTDGSYLHAHDLNAYAGAVIIQHGEQQALFGGVGGPIRGAVLPDLGSGLENLSCHCCHGAL